MGVLPSTRCWCSAGTSCQGALQCGEEWSLSIALAVQQLGDKQKMSRKCERELRLWAKPMHSVRQKSADTLLPLSCRLSCPTAQPGWSEPSCPQHRGNLRVGKFGSKYLIYGQTTLGVREAYPAPRREDVPCSETTKTDLGGAGQSLHATNSFSKDLNDLLTLLCVSAPK